MPYKENEGKVFINRKDGRRVRVLTVAKGVVSYKNEKTGRFGTSRLSTFFRRFRSASFAPWSPPG